MIFSLFGLLLLVFVFLAFAVLVARKVRDIQSHGHQHDGNRSIKQIDRLVIVDAQRMLKHRDDKHHENDLAERSLQVVDASNA